MVLTRAKSKATPQERPQAPFRILDLPAELLGNICDHLPDSDLINLRCVCRALDAHSSTAFGQRFFHHLIAILHPTSLTTLYEICRHPVLPKLAVSGSVTPYHSRKTTRQTRICNPASNSLAWTH
jgi:hypothetical protein